MIHFFVRSYFAYLCAIKKKNYITTRSIQIVLEIQLTAKRIIIISNYTTLYEHLLYLKNFVEYMSHNFYRNVL